MNKIPLSQLLGHISDELWKANDRALQSGRASMQFTECEVEFAFEAENMGETGVELYVLNIGGEIRKGETNTIKVKFGAIPQQPLVNPAVVPGSAPKPRRQPR
jgi:hypothetical protein